MVLLQLGRSGMFDRFEEISSKESAWTRALRQEEVSSKDDEGTVGTSGGGFGVAVVAGVSIRHQRGKPRCGAAQD